MSDTIAENPRVLFAAAGRSLFGDDWINATAAALNVNRVNVKRWANGYHDRIPPSVMAEVGELLRIEARRLVALADTIAPRA